MAQSSPRGDGQWGAIADRMVSRSMALSVAALTFGLSSRVFAQGSDDCFPSKTSNEAHTMAIFAVPLAFGAAGAPARTPSGRIELGIEVSYLPKVDRATATPTVCRPGKGPENTNLLFAAPRPRIALSLPSGLALEASWVPPVRMAQVETNLIGVALSRTTSLNRRGAMLSLRAHATFGTVKAPITCNDQSLHDATSVCYHGTRSNDSFKPNILGFEAAVGWSLGNTLHPYLGAGYNHLAPRFQVNFTDQFGAVDRRKVSVDMSRGVLFAGATWSATSAISLTGEVYSAPADAVTARMAARVRLGRSSPVAAAPVPPANSAPVPGATPDR